MSTERELCLMNFVTSGCSFIGEKFAAEPCETLYATDASPSGAGGCFASIAREDWLALYYVGRARGGKLSMLDWKDEEPLSNMHDVRAAVAPLALKLKWTTLFSYRFFCGTGEPDQPPHAPYTCRNTGTAALGTCGFARGLGSRLKRTVELTKINFLLRKQGFWCLVFDIALELVWVLTWAIPADALSRSKPIESWYASLPKLPSTPTAVLASAPALSEVELFGEPLSAASHTAGEHVRSLESSRAFSCLNSKPVHVENAPFASYSRWWEHFHTSRYAATASKGCQRRMER